jgi:DNA-3-methyladenine glycosylase II
MSIRRSTRIASTTLPSAPAVIESKKRSASNQAATTSTKKQKSSKSPKTSKQDDAKPAVPNGTSDEPEFKVPVTPAKKAARRTAPSKAKHPPLTPTPSLISVIRAPYSSGDIDDATPPPDDRPVGPHITNAPLVTPGGTQHVAYEDTLPDSTPSKTGLPRPTATANTLLDKACAHLISVDPRLEAVIAQHPCSIFSAKGLAEVIDPFRSLSSGIMGQQVSGAAAKSIKNKFVALFNEDADLEDDAKFPTPAQVAATDIARLRLAGLSQRKAEYIQGLAQKFVDKELTNEMLMRASDDEVMEKLIAVRGLGKWSVEMFACFGLKRMDILSTGDLGVQRGMAAFFGRNVKALKAKGGGKCKFCSSAQSWRHLLDLLQCILTMLIC